jgi:hypothetical protein
MTVFYTDFCQGRVDVPFLNQCFELKKILLLKFDAFDSRWNIYGIWSNFLKKCLKRGTPFKRGADGIFGGKEGRCTLYLTGAENTNPI